MRSTLFPKNRFAPSGEAAIGVVPRAFIQSTHTVSGFGGRVESVVPSRGETGLSAGPRALKLIEEGVEWYREYKRNAAVKEYTDQASGQVGLGEDVYMVLSEPGSGSERVEFYRNQTPPILSAPDSVPAIVRVPAQQLGKTGQTNNIVIVKNGSAKVVPVQELPNSQPSSNQSQPANNVESEPGRVRILRGENGDLFRGELRQLPADARLDSHYPGSGKWNNAV